MEKFNAIEGQFTRGLDRLMSDIDSKLKGLKQELIKDICTELKGKVLKTWQEGTDKFYNEAKSMMSEYSRAPSVASDVPRSRSASRDFTLKAGATS